jgi:hypothetical protein
MEIITVINYPGNTNQYKLVDLIQEITIYDFQSVLILQTSSRHLYSFVRDTSTCNQTVNSNPIYVPTSLVFHSKRG